MRAHRVFCWAAIICGALTVKSGESIKSWSGEEQPGATATELSPEVQAERNKVPVRQLYQELFTQGRYEMIGQVFARQCPVHFGSRNVGLAQAIAEGKGWRSAAPDLFPDRCSADGESDVRLDLFQRHRNCWRRWN